MLPLWAYYSLYDPRDTGALCNGTCDDTQAVQRLFDSVQDGGTITIGGPCAIRGVALRNKKKVRIVGLNRNSGFIALGISSLKAITMGPILLMLDQCEECTVENLTIDCQWYGVSTIGVSRSTSCGILYNHLGKVGPGIQAVVISVANKHNVYEGNIIDNTGYRTGGAIRGMWIGNCNTSEVEYYAYIAKNKITNLDATAIGTIVHGMKVIDNHCENIGGAGVVVAQPAINIKPETYIVRGNTCIACDFHGIQSDVVGDGPRTESVICNGNICLRNGHSGIYINKGDRWIVTDNISKDNGYLGNQYGGRGISVSQSSDILIANNIISGNPDNRVQGTGIDIQGWAGDGVKNVAVHGNICEYQKFTGITLGTADKIAEDVVIEQNTCRQNPTGIFTEGKGRNCTVGQNFTHDNVNPERITLVAV